MKQNKYILLILGLALFSGCAKEKTPTLLSHWQNKNLQESTQLLRSIASTQNQAQCLGDMMSSEFLKKEVEEYESRLTGNPIRGTWKHLDLSGLPIPQANFLAKYGNSIGDLANPESIDYSSCNDLVCIFNKVYNKEETYIAGYVHYLWYLRFGTYLALDNQVHNQKSPIPGVYGEQSYPLSSYLYNESELYGLWKLTHLLNGRYLLLQNLHEVSRVPRTASLEGFSAAACGLAYGDSKITLADACVATLPNDKDQGFLYRGIIHEFSHLLDYSEGRKRGMMGGYRSTEQDYLDLVGFYKEEYAQADGTLVSTWKLRPGAKYVRDYAATNPLENFAESLAVYRYYAEEAKSKLDPTQYSWIGSSYFEQEEFTAKSSMQKFLDKYKSKYLSRIFFNVLTCSKNAKAERSFYLTAKDFPNLKFTDSMLNCLSVESEILANKLTAEVQLSESEGCSATKSPSNLSTWKSEVKDVLMNSISSYVDKIAKNPEYLNQMENFNKLLGSYDVANDSLLSCYDGDINKNLSSCYNREVAKSIKQNGANVGIPDDQLDELAHLYLSRFSYRDFSERLILTYKSIVESNGEVIRLKASDLWEQCFSISHSDSESPRGKKYVPNKGYIVSSMYNCLNDKMPESLDEIIKAIEYQGVEIRNEQEKSIMLEFVTPVFIGLLDVYHDESTKIEETKLGFMFDESKDKITEFLLADFFWVKSVISQSENTSSCKMESIQKIEALPLFHLKRDIFGKRAEDEICKPVMNDDKFKVFIKESSDSLEANVYSKIEPMLKLRAQERAVACLSKIPWKWDRTKSVVKLPRKLCLSTDWKNIERSVVSEILEMPEVKRFNISVRDIENKVSSYEDSIKDKTSDTFF